jgi:hypothetical protein
MSEFETLGLSLIVSDPLLKVDRSTLSTNLTSRIASYTHELRREGGFYSAAIKMNLNEDDLNDWIQNGIGRHIEVYNPSGIIVFEGFVNSLDIKTGEDTFPVGPLTEIGNRVSVTYSTIDTSTNPPTLGIRVTMAVSNNTASQTKYGIWHKIKSINGATATDATQLRNMIVNDPTRCYPATSGDMSFGGSGSFTVTINILGYWHWLLAYYYANSATGDINLSTKITNVLTTSTNAIFSSDYSKITANTTQVGAYASGEQTGMAILKDLCTKGDSSFNPYSIGVYAGRRVVYKPISTEIKYQRRRGKPVTDNLDGEVKAWDIQPVEWLFRPDFLVGRNIPITAATLGLDPRANLIESVKFSTPYKLSINGRKLSQIDQVLAQRGIGGM